MRQFLAAFTALALFFSIASATEFSEYSYLIPSDVFLDSAKPLVAGSSCAAFDGADVQLARGSVAEEKDFTQSLNAASTAKERLALASGSAKIQKAVSPLGIPDVGYRLQSWLCFSYAVEALRAASLSCDLGLAVVDERLADLEKATGSGYSGAATGVMAEAAEARQSIADGKSSSEGFAYSFLAAARTANASWSSFSSTPSAPAFVAALNAFVSSKSLLREEMLLAKKCRDALDSLQAERDSLAAEAERALSLAEFKQKQLDSQKLFLITGTEVALAGSAVSSAESAEGSLDFYEAVQEASELLGQGRELQSEANSLSSSKRTGYLGNAVLMLREASSTAGSAASKLEWVDSESAGVEAALRNAVLSRQNEANRLISSKMAANPLAAGNAQALLDAEMRDFVQALPRTRGERTAFYARELTRLQEIVEQASSSSSVDAIKDRVRADANDLNQLMESAEDDGVDSSFARERLARVSAALEGIPSTEGSSTALYYLQDELNAARDDVVASALEQYGYLEGDWPRLLESADFLSSSDRRKVAEYERFFAGGSLDVEAAAGKLGEIRDFVDRALADVDARAPSILKQEFERTGVANVSLGTVPLDDDSKGLAEIVLRNDLSLSYDGAVEVALPQLALLEKAAYVMVLNKSAELGVSGGKLFVKGIKAGGEYRALVEFGGVFCRTSVVRESTVWATESAAEKKIVVDFECDADATVYLEKNVGCRVAKAFGEKGVSASASGETVSATAEAAQGNNSVELHYWIANPIQVERSVSSSSDEVVLEYSLHSLVSLDNAVVSLAEELSCASPPQDGGVSVFSDLKQKHWIAGSAVALEFSGDLAAGETKTARVSIKCVSQAAPSPLTEYGENFSSTEEQAVPELEPVVPTIASDLSEKRALLEEYSSARDAAEAALTSFEKAFSVGEGLKKKKTSAEESGLLAKKRVETALKALDGVWAGSQENQSVLGTYSLNYLRARLQDLDDARQAVESAVDSARETASQAISIAEARQTQFGSQQTAGGVDAAKKDFENGMFLSAWLRAQAASGALQGPAGVSSQTGLASAGNNFWLLGVAGLGLIAALAWVFWGRGGKELKEL
ncbi:hypothetical protein H0O03_00105 [Candidatus Micrarchaeota archaeon]|nr:hypothetical protein [Candidatus Micrarchaeota archaeon]